MTDPNTVFVIGSYAVGVLLIVIEIVLVRRRLARAQAVAAKPLHDDDEMR